MFDSGTQAVSSRSQRAHLVRCGWFWAWAMVGAAGAVGAVALGPVVLLPAILAGAVMVRSQGGRQSWPGLLAGAGLVSLVVAYVQRAGPGTTCWHTAAAVGCAQHLDPVPWLIVGILLVGVGLLVQSHRDL